MIDSSQSENVTQLPLQACFAWKCGSQSFLQGQIFALLLSNVSPSCFVHTQYLLLQKWFGEMGNEDVTLLIWQVLFFEDIHVCCRSVSKTRQSKLENFQYLGEYLINHVVLWRNWCFNCDSFIKTADLCVQWLFWM